MNTIEERLTNVENSLTQIVKVMSDATTHQTKQAFELGIAITVAIEEMARQTGTDINALILVLEKHCELLQKNDHRADLSLVQAVLARLRTPGLGSR
jgi:hypothetical protein